MKTRKAELRSILIDIIAGRETAFYGADNIGNLLSGVAEVLERRTGKQHDTMTMFPHNAQLDYEDKLLAQEAIWDLIIERVLTPGLDFPNSELPWVRVHSDAKHRLKERA